MLMVSGFYIDIDRDDNYNYESNYSYKDMEKHIRDIIYGNYEEDYDNDIYIV